MGSNGFPYGTVSSVAGLVAVAIAYFYFVRADGVAFATITTALASLGGFTIGRRSA